MKKNTVFELQLQLIINDSLYHKSIIDENTYVIANEKLLELLKFSSE